MWYEYISTVLKDALKYRKVLLGAFIVFSVAGLVVGLLWPKFYMSTASIYIEEENILGPLMRGAAVQTEVVDRAKNAREIVYGRDFILKVLQNAGFLPEDITPQQEEWIVDETRSRMTIVNLGRNLIKLSYKDTDAEKTYNILAKTLDLLIEESLAAKLNESRSAFEFINKQVNEYHDKLVAAEERLKEFRSKNVDIRAGSDQEVSARIQVLQQQVNKLSQELREAEINKETLLAQLAGEAETAAGLSRAEEFRTRIREMQSQLDTLLLTYHDTYPDVIRLHDQIQEMKNVLKREESGKTKDTLSSTVVIEGIVVDERIQASPVYQQLRTDLYAANSLIKTLTSRLKDTQRSLDEESALGVRTHGLRASLAELNRDYKVNSDIHQDFLRRREAARVSMNVDLEQKGLNLRIDEPPFLPHTTSGLRLMHFVLIGFLAGLIIPLGALYGILQVDPRVITLQHVHDITDITIIGTVYEYYTDVEIQEIQKEVIAILIIGMFAVLVVGITALLLK